MLVSRKFSLLMFFAHNVICKSLHSILSPLLIVSNSAALSLTHILKSVYDEDGDESTLVSDSEKYRFCFVEKNRIDSFSQIAAHSPAKQTAF